MERRPPIHRLQPLLAMCAGLLLFCASTLAQALTVQVMGAGQGSEPFLEALREELPGLRVVTVAEPGVDVVVALHEGALPEARASQKPRLVLLPAAGVDLAAGESAIYWAPSLSDQLRLAQAIMPGLRRVGVLAGAADAGRVQALRSAAATRRIEVQWREAEPALLARQVGEVAPTADLLLAPADPHLYSRENLKPVLLAAYRQNRVFIGPTPAWVRAGSLATLYATPQTLAADVAEAVRAWQQHGRWPAPALASRFDVITNPQVARSLGLRLPDAESLTRSLQSGKVVPWP